MNTIIPCNMISVRFYGEVEFFFGCLKLLLIIILIGTGLAIDLGGVSGQERLGFLPNWKDPGPLAEHIVTGGIGRFCILYLLLY